MLASLVMDTRKPSSGRPPAAVNESGEPEATSEWQQVSFRIRPSTKALLDAIRGLSPRAPLWRVIEDILHAHVESLPAQDRRLIKALMERHAGKDRD
jgi:hypothetical protein